jgi:hypothetical protein
MDLDNKRTARRVFQCGIDDERATEDLDGSQCQPLISWPLVLDEDGPEGCGLWERPRVSYESGLDSPRRQLPFCLDL